MNVRLDVHLDLDDERQFVWWASSPDVPGFYTAADHLQLLLDQATAAVRDVLNDPDVEILPTVVDSEDRSAGDADAEPGRGNRSVSLVA